MKVKDLFEAKQVGSLYHHVDLEKMEFILHTNSLAARNYNKISATRSKHLQDYLGVGAMPIFKIELDGDKLSNKFKIAPHKFKSKTNVSMEEFEEVIDTHKIQNLSTFVKAIHVSKTKLEQFRKLFGDDEWDRRELEKLDAVMSNLHILGNVKITK